MLKSMKNCKAVGFILSHLGLVVASMILVGIVFGFSAVNVWQADAEAYNTAKTLTRSVNQINDGLVESDIVWEVPGFSSVSSVELDRFGICVISETFFAQKQVRREEFDCELVVVNESFVSLYGAGFQDFHQNFLKSVFNKSGCFDDALNFSEVTTLLEFVSLSSNQSLNNPIILLKDDAVMVSKINVFFINNSGLQKENSFIVAFETDSL